MLIIELQEWEKTSKDSFSAVMALFIIQIIIMKHFLELSRSNKLYGK